MRFLFVDRIIATDGDRIEGRRGFPASEPLRYESGFIAPGAISEAIGQLASWLCLQRNDFSARPVFLFADAIHVEADVPVGSDVTLTANIANMDAETFVFSGQAMLNGRVVQRINNCSGYFMPLASLEDPTITRERFAALVSAAGLQLEGAAGPAFPFDTLVDDVLAFEEQRSIRTCKVFAGDQPYYRDHFPRFPVTPIVMLNEMIGEAAARLFGRGVQVRRINDIKIKSFVKPGDIVETRLKAELPLLDTSLDGSRIAIINTTAEIIKDGKRILRGRYEYLLTNPSSEMTP